MAAAGRWTMGEGRLTMERDYVYNGHVVCVRCARVCVRRTHLVVRWALLCMVDMLCVRLTRVGVRRTRFVCDTLAFVHDGRVFGYDDQGVVDDGRILRHVTTSLRTAAGCMGYNGEECLHRVASHIETTVA